jgi:Guanine nucleotide exchange factor synembryn
MNRPPLQGGLLYIINALASLEFRQESSGEILPDVAQYFRPAVDKFLAVLDESLKQYTSSELDTQAIPLLTLLRKINEAADENIRNLLKSELLPKDAERDVPLGQSDSLPSRLLKLTTAGGLINLPEVVSAFLFELSDRDPTKFVQNVGYGYAAGYLMSHKIPVPENAKSASSKAEQVPINPITGQRLDKEKDVDLPEMTQEEKEREAERLFVLFERLKTTGVVDVQNPVHQAMQEGRIQEVDGSDSDD